MRKELSLKCVSRDFLPKKPENKGKNQIKKSKNQGNKKLRYVSPIVSFFSN